jgi:hypothetical protein
VDKKRQILVGEEWYDASDHLIAPTTYSQVEEVHPGIFCPMKAVSEIEEMALPVESRDSQGRVYQNRLHFPARTVTRSFQWIEPGLAVPREILITDKEGQEVHLWARFYAYRVNQNLPDEMFAPPPSQSQ